MEKLSYRIVPYYRPRRSQNYFVKILSKYFSVKRPPPFHLFSVSYFMVKMIKEILETLSTIKSEIKEIIFSEYLRKMLEKE